MAILVTKDEIRVSGTQPWQLDNTALKGIRFQGESPPGTQSDRSGVDLTHSDPYYVLTIKRDRGPAFEMVEPRLEWSWKKMLNRLDDATLERVIGPGVTSIFCKPIGKPGASSYDHKRDHHANHGGVPFEDVNGAPADCPVWDFVIHRGDGEAIRLHPNQKNRKVTIENMNAPIITAADAPDAGRGLSDGRGTFRRMLARAPSEVVKGHNAAIACSADTRGGGADWRGWQDWDAWDAWGSDGNRGDGAEWRGWQHRWSASSSDDAWYASRGAWNSHATWRGAQGGPPPPPGAPPPKRAPPQPPRV